MSPRLCHLLAGIEAGILGGAAGVLWTVVSSLWQGRPGWAHLALLGSIVDERLLWRRDFWLAALTGAALSLVSTGFLGALFGLVVRRPANAFRVLLAGVGFGAAAFLLCSAALANRWHWVGNPAPHERTTLVACLLFGALLGQYPRLLRSVSSTFSPGD